jgi:hypothetical protein
VGFETSSICSVHTITRDQRFRMGRWTRGARSTKCERMYGDVCTGSPRERPHRPDRHRPGSTRVVLHVRHVPCCRLYIYHAPCCMRLSNDGWLTGVLGPHAIDHDGPMVDSWPAACGGLAQATLLAQPELDTKPVNRNMPQAESRSTSRRQADGPRARRGCQSHAAAHPEPGRAAFRFRLCPSPRPGLPAGRAPAPLPVAP